MLFLNPDTEIKDNAIQEMMAALDANPAIGLVGARLLNSDLTVQTSCVQSFPGIANPALDAEVLRPAFPASRLWGAVALYLPVSNAEPVDAVSGACMMLKRQDSGTRPDSARSISCTRRMSTSVCG